MGYRIINGKIYQFGDFTKDVNPKIHQRTSRKNTFQSILNKEKSEKCNLTISNHASQRLKNRNIYFNEKDLHNINEAMDKASKKGAKDSLIVYKDVALIASIKNRTIITAVDKKSSKENVFTNIDSVVLLDE